MARERAADLGAILLAAGASRRLGRPKQLIHIDGMPLVARQARILLELNPTILVVVTGHERKAVEGALDGLPLDLVHNPQWSGGMGRSLACGIAAMPERVRGAMVLLCDQWKIGANDLSALVRGWQDDKTCAVVSAWEGTTGPPAILPRSLFEKLSRLKGDRGASSILKHWSGRTLAIETATAAFDLDTSVDLEQEKSRPQG